MAAPKTKDRNEKAREKMQREAMEHAAVKGGIGPARKVKRATIDDLVVVRDAKGNVKPVEATSLFMGMSFLIIPVRYRDVQEMDLSAPATEWPMSEQVRLVREHVVDPDLSKLTEDDVRNEWDPFTWSDLVATIVMYSGPMRTRSRADDDDDEDGEGNA